MDDHGIGLLFGMLPGKVQLVIGSILAFLLITFLTVLYFQGRLTW